MTQDEIIELAKKAGMMSDGEMWFTPSYENCDVDQADLEAFAKLVAEQEREACAKLAKQFGGDWAEDAIRARGQA